MIIILILVSQIFIKKFYSVSHALQIVQVQSESHGFNIITDTMMKHQFVIIPKHAIQRRMALDICQRDDYIRGKTHIWSYRGAPQQKFLFQKDGNKITIKCVKSRKYLKIQKNSQQNGARLRQQDNQNEEPQKFTLEKIQEGQNEYIIYTFCGKVLDCYKHYSNSGTDVVQWQYQGDQAQKWIIQDFLCQTKDKEGKIVQQTHYSIIGKKSKKAMDVFTDSIVGNTVICQYWGGYNQLFQFQQHGDFTAIKCKKSQKYLTVKNGSRSGFTAILQKEFSNHESQKFKIVKVQQPNEYVIYTFCGKALTVLLSYKRHGTQVFQFEFNNGDNQKWIIKQAQVVMKIK